MPQPNTLPRVSHRVIELLLLLALVGLCVLRSSIGTRLDSFTVDEPWHVVAGTSYVRSGSFHLNPEHPPLVKLAVGSAMPDTFRLRPGTALLEKTQERKWVEETLFEDNDARQAQATARATMWAFHAALLLALSLLIWRAAGWVWAAGTLAFLALEPTIGAHLPVVMTDLPLALTLLIAVVTAGILASNWQWRWAIACGLAVGLALGAKHSALAGLAGLFAVLLVASASAWRDERWRGVGRRLGKLMVVALVAVAVLWGQYGFRFHAAPDGSDPFNRPMPDKIAELKLEHWRTGIAFADRFHLLPRAYLWGLADTVRTGVEGRGISEHFIWGRTFQGQAPWFAWPAILVSKLPLGMLLAALLGAALLWRARIPASARWMVWAMFGACAVHLLALIGSGGVWGGVRHALPVIAGVALLAGAAVAQAWQRRSRIAGAVVFLSLVATLGLTVREPRLWEYHNELVGGSAGAYRYFSNEGLDLGQRFGEIRAFHDREIRASGLPMYSDYWMGDVQIRAAKLNYRRAAQDLNDTNVEGRFEGYFVQEMGSTLPWPSWNWDPREIFKDLELQARFGHVGIWKGTVVRPQWRAGGMSNRVMDYIYKENGKDWALVARRLEEVAALMPQRVDAGIELGNAYVRLGDGRRAIQAYRRLLDQEKIPLDRLIHRQVEAQVTRIAASQDVASVGPMRNPWLE